MQSDALLEVLVGPREGGGEEAVPRLASERRRERGTPAPWQGRDAATSAASCLAYGSPRHRRGHPLPPPDNVCGGDGGK
jgi:hypothetical protein